MITLTATSVLWGDITINGPSQAGSFNLRDIKGWVETPGPSFEDASNYGVGSKVTPISYGRRTVTVTGWCQSAGLRDSLLRTLWASLAPKSKSTATELLSVTHGGDTLTADAQLTRVAALPEQGWGVGYFSFAVEWTCADPLRYGPWQSFTSDITGTSSGVTPPVTPPVVLAAAAPSGQFVLNNPGNADAPAVYTLNGPIVGPGVDVGGHRVTYGFDLAAGDALVLDTARGAAFLNAAYRAPASGSALLSELVLPSGYTTVQAIGDVGSGGTPWVTAVFRPAYW